MKKLVYFAHPRSHYGKRVESSCGEKIRIEGQHHFQADEIEVFNPNQEWLSRVYKKRKEEEYEKPFDVFLEIVQVCDGVAGVTFGDGKIGAGVYTELMEAYNYGKPTFILTGASKFFVRFDPENHHGKLALTIEETRERLEKDYI